MKFIIRKNVEKNSVSIRIRKPVTNPDLSSHVVLTDDVFSYVDFFFKTNKRRGMEKKAGTTINQRRSFYWEQAKNFYIAAKSLPIESAPLPMYYCMLNAAKAYLLCKTDSYESVEKDFNGHGLREGNESDSEKMPNISLETIYIKRKGQGVFVKFAQILDPAFNEKWPNTNGTSFSIKELLYQLPFAHSAYIATYKLPRKEEKFIPLNNGASPRFCYGKDPGIHLVVNLDRSYFEHNAKIIPEDVKRTIPDQFTINELDPFQLVSKESCTGSQVKELHDRCRSCFSYISAPGRLWYLKREPVDADSVPNMDTMTLIFAITHRFSEIVRYKPEQLVQLLNSKENWLVHEFLSLALDQFMDGIACEITGREIMCTRHKAGIQQ